MHVHGDADERHRDGLPHWAKQEVLEILKRHPDARPKAVEQACAKIAAEKGYAAGQ